MLGLGLALGLAVRGGIGFALGAKPSWWMVLNRLNGHSKNSDEHNAARIQNLMDILYPLAIAFFAGFVFSTLIPHALFHSTGSPLAFGLGIATMAFLSKYIFKSDPCCEGGHDHKGYGAMSLIAMSVCSLNDGLLIGLLNPEWYSGLNLGMIVHKITSSFAIAQVLRRTKYRGAALALFGLVYTLISPAALMAAHSNSVQSFPYTDFLMSFSAGLLAFVTLASLFPHAKFILKKRPKLGYAFALAFMVSVGLGFWHTALHNRAETHTE